MSSQIPICDAGSRWPRLPAWLISLGLHLVLAVLGMWLIRSSPPAKGLDEKERPAAIVLVQREAGQTRYYADESAGASPAVDLLREATMSAGGASTPRDGSDPLTGSTMPPAIPGIELPKLPGGPEIGQPLVPAIQPRTSRSIPKLPFAKIDEEAVLAADALVPREQQPTGRPAKISLFGSAPAQGRSFVFVIDRSKSMGGDGLGAIAAAAKELEERIGALTAEQRFQVVTYNDSAAYYSGRELAPATDENKAALVKYIAGTIAVGGTEHERGLRAALSLKPEVIFLLTDGGDPHLKPAQCAAIRDLAAGRTSIHCLHFGRGPDRQAASDHFLRRLAGENGGSYVYIDMK